VTTPDHKPERPGLRLRFRPHSMSEILSRRSVHMDPAAARMRRRSLRSSGSRRPPRAPSRPMRRSAFAGSSSSSSGRSRGNAQALWKRLVRSRHGIGPPSAPWRSAGRRGARSRPTLGGARRRRREKSRLHRRGPSRPRRPQRPHDPHGRDRRHVHAVALCRRCCPRRRSAIRAYSPSSEWLRCLPR
jgi:hypothetical protein